MVVDGRIKFKPKLTVEQLEDIENDIKIPKHILLDYEGLSIRYFEWLDFIDYPYVLDKLAQKFRKKRVRCKGSLYCVYGDDEDGIIKLADSNKVSLRGGKFNPSTGKIKVVLPRGPRKKK